MADLEINAAGSFELTPEASARNLLAYVLQDAGRLYMYLAMSPVVEDTHVRKLRALLGRCEGCGFGEDETCQCHERGPDR